MKVGFIATVFMQFGGTETWHRTLLPHIEGLSHFCVFGQFKGDPSFLPPNVKVVKGAKGAIEVFKECDVVITWGITNIDTLKREAGKNPIVIAVHHGDPSSIWARNCTNSIKDQVNRIVAVHPEVARIYDGEWIPNAIDPSRITKPKDNRLRELWKLEDKKICFWCARYSPEKNPYLAQRIATHLPDDWVMVMAGQPQPGFKIIEHTQIRHVGPTSHPGSWLSIADCFLSTSDQEGFGLSIGEAMLAKVPVVGTPVGLCTYPGVCKTFLIKTSRNKIANLITTPPQENQLERAYELASGFSVNQQAIHWNRLIKETLSLSIMG